MSGKYTITLSNGTPFDIYPLEQNGPGSLSTPRLIQETKPDFLVTGVNNVSNTFTIAGDQTATFINGFSFIIADSTGNDGIYNVSSTVVDGFGDTVISTVENVIDATVDGTISLLTFRLNDDLTYRFVAGFPFEVINSAGGLNDGTFTVNPTGAIFTGTQTIIPVVEDIPSDALPFGAIQYAVPAAETISSFNLPGKGSINFGENMISNIVHHLENFASTVAPANPLRGQLWFDTSTNTMKRFDGVGFVATIDLDTNDLLFKDPENPLSPNSDVVMSGSDATNPKSGIALRPLVDPNTGDPIFRILSSTGTELFTVEYSGDTVTTNALRVLATANSYFAADIEILDTHGIVASSGGSIKTDGSGGTWEIQAGGVGLAPVKVKNSAGDVQFQVRGDGKTEVINGLVVDTDTLVVDDVNNRIGVNKANPTNTLDVVGNTMRIDSQIPGGIANVDIAAATGQISSINLYEGTTVYGTIESDPTVPTPGLHINRTGANRHITLGNANNKVHVGGTTTPTVTFEVTGTSKFSNFATFNATPTINATLDMATHQINNVVDPTLNQDAATKKYVDDNIGIAVGGVDELQKLNDVVNDATTTAGPNDVLYFDGAKWDNHTLVASDISGFEESVQDAVGTFAISTGIQNGISVTYDDAGNKYNFDVDDFDITLTGDVTGTNTVTNLSNVSIATTVSIPSANITDFTEAVQDAVGTLAISTGVQNGITVSYDDINNQYDFDVDDFTITLDGDLTGSVGISNLGNATLTATVVNDSHTHDTRYYTETETDTLLLGKSDTGHIHDDRYYTETELNAGQLNNLYYTETELDSGTLDTRYYTETEVDNLLTPKAPLASPALTGTPTAPTATGGTNTTQIATTAFVQNAVGSSGGLGVGQTWQDVSGSRTSGVTYTNTTGAPIMVVTDMNTGSVVVNGTLISSYTQVFVVPNGHTYVVTATLTEWSELR